MFPHCSHVCCIIKSVHLSLYAGCYLIVSPKMSLFGTIYLVFSLRPNTERDFFCYFRPNNVGCRTFGASLVFTLKSQVISMVCLSSDAAGITTKVVTYPTYI